MIPEQITLAHGPQQLVGSHYPGGERAPVLLVHGFTGNREGPKRLFHLLACTLAGAGHPVRAFDRLGHGQSDGVLGDIALEDEIAQIAGQIASFGGGPVHVFAHSLGGLECAILAGRRPDLFASLQLWAPAGSIVDEVSAGQIIRQDATPLLEGGVFDVEGQALTRSLYDSLVGVDPYEGLDRYQGALLIHHGDRDDRVPLDYGRRFAAAFRRPEALKVYPGGDHLFATIPHRAALFAAVLEHLEAPGG